MFKQWSDTLNINRCTLFLVEYVVIKILSNMITNKLLLFYKVSIVLDLYFSWQ